MKRNLAGILKGSLALVLLAVLGFVVWGSMPLGPLAEARTALEADGAVQVEERGEWIVFRPVNGQPDTALIFYPGGRVDYRSYAPAAREIAAQGFQVIVVRMPLNLAVFGADRAADVIAAYPQVQHWAVGGHSLGGAMAAQFAAQNPGIVQGLVLWAAYPADNSSLEDADLQVASIYGARDGLAAPEKIDASRRLLPADTRFAEITGGNHAQFGWYGPQDGDGTAEISPQAQQDQIVSATVALLSTLREP